MANRSITRRLLPLLLAVLLLSGCAGEQQPPASVDVQSQGQSQDQGSTENIRILTPLTHPDSCTQTEEGFYEWISGIPGEYLLTYTDFASQKKVALCGQPNCLHDGPQCTAWTGDTLGSLFAAPDGSIYGINTVHVEADETSYQILWRMERDGTKRHTVMKLEASEYFCNAIAGSERALYLTVATYHGIKRLLRFCPDTRETECLLELEEGEWLYGAFEDQLVILLCQNTDAETSAFYYRLYDTVSGEATEIFRYTYSDRAGDRNIQTITEGDRIYVIRPTEPGLAALSYIDMKTGQETQVSQAVPYPDDGKLQLEDFLDGCVRVSVWMRETPENREAYLIHLDTGEVMPHSPSVLLYGDQLPMPVLAQAPGRYLVTTAYDMVPITLYGKDGAAYTSEAKVAVHAFVSRESFLAGEPEYQSIEDTTTN